MRYKTPKHNQDISFSTIFLFYTNVVLFIIELIDFKW